MHHNLSALKMTLLFNLLRNNKQITGLCKFWIYNDPKDTHINIQ